MATLSSITQNNDYKTNHLNKKKTIKKPQKIQKTPKNPKNLKKHKRTLKKHKKTQNQKKLKKYHLYPLLGFSSLIHPHNSFDVLYNDIDHIYKWHPIPVTPHYCRYHRCPLSRFLPYAKLCCGNGLGSLLGFFEGVLKGVNWVQSLMNYLKSICWHI